MPEQTVHVVFAELLDDSFSTADGEHFVVLAGYLDREAALQRITTERSGRDWGRFASPDEPSDRGWWIAVETVPLVSAPRVSVQEIAGI